MTDPATPTTESEWGKSVLRWSVSTDGSSYEVPMGANPILAVALTDDGDFVEFWAENHGGTMIRTFTVIGTGPGFVVPFGSQYRGTTARSPQGLIWHLYEVIDPRPVDSRTDA